MEVDRFRFVSGLFFSALLFSVTWPALFSGLFPVCFSGPSFVFNKMPSFVSALFPVCFLALFIVFNNFPGSFFKKRILFSVFSRFGGGGIEFCCLF